MSRFLNNNINHFHYIYSLRFKVFYSASAATSHTKFLVDTLVNSLGFSNEEAISTTSKVTRLRPRTYKPNLVFNFLEHNVGLDKTQIKKVVSSVPKLLLCDVDKHLKPKIGILQELGLSGSDLVKIITNSGHLFSCICGEYVVRLNVNYLRDLVGNDDIVARLIKTHSWLLSFAVHELMPPNISLLRNLGFSSLDIDKLLLWNPRVLTIKPESLKGIVDRVEKTLSISRDGRMFIHGVYALAWMDESTVKRRLEIFRSFGWSDSDICALIQKLPVCLTRSEAKIRDILNFYMKELGYESCYLASHPAFFTYSLERRVLPRYEILKLLNDKDQTKCGQNLYSAVSSPESKFLKRYVLPVKDEMPEVYDLYIKSRIK